MIIFNWEPWQFYLLTFVLLVCVFMLGVAATLLFVKHVDKDFQKKLREYRKKNLEKGIRKIDEEEKEESLPKA